MCSLNFLSKFASAKSLFQATETDSGLSSLFLKVSSSKSNCAIGQAYWTLAVPEGRCKQFLQWEDAERNKHLELPTLPQPSPPKYYGFNSSGIWGCWQKGQGLIAQERINTYHNFMSDLRNCFKKKKQSLILNYFIVFLISLNFRYYHQNSTI